jgi:hypothetical protein
MASGQWPRQLNCGGCCDRLHWAVAEVDHFYRKVGIPCKDSCRAAVTDVTAQSGIKFKHNTVLRTSSLYRRQWAAV